MKSLSIKPSKPSHSSFFKNFLREEDGVTLPMIGVAFMALVGAAGVAVDSGRAQLVQAKLSAALDAAGLAAGATVNTVNIETEVDKYLAANFPAGYLGSQITSRTITISDDKTIVTLAAEATVPTTFMGIMGFGDITVHADSEITRSNKGLELVMVLDNTGSMSGTRLSSLKTAATDMVNILYGGQTTVEDLWIGLVPFSQSVNVGSGRTNWLDPVHFATLNWGITSWGGCIDERWTGRDVTDDPPSVETFQAYFWPDMGNNDWIRDDGTYRSITSSRGPNLRCPAVVTPMTGNKTSILNAIQAMTAVGNTHVNVGAVWGWRMISPRWRGLWGGDMDANNLPLDYNQPLMNKAVVIMTDGDNTMDNDGHTAYGFLSEGRLGTTTSTSVAADNLDAKLSAICTSMKNQNIFVYTIAFGNPGSTIRNLLRNCATQPDYYFNSVTSTDLNNAFRAIGDSLANLRVSK